jgi:hypothetical protein
VVSWLAMSSFLQREWFRWGMVLAVAFWLLVLGWTVEHLRLSPWIGLHASVRGAFVVVDRCDQESPASRAGVVPGDTLSTLDGKAIPWQAFLVDHDQSPSWADVDRFWDSQRLLRELIQHERSVQLQVRGTSGPRVLSIVPLQMPWGVLFARIAIPNLLTLI